MRVVVIIRAVELLVLIVIGEVNLLFEVLLRGLVLKALEVLLLLVLLVHEVVRVMLLVVVQVLDGKGRRGQENIWLVNIVLQLLLEVRRLQFLVVFLDKSALVVDTVMI